MCFSSHISGFSSPETNRHSSFIASSTIQIIFIKVVHANFDTCFVDQIVCFLISSLSLP